MNTKLLKQRILDLAISGKLVEQNPADEPASELLKRIRKEKEAMVKAGKLKKKDLDSKPIAAEEIPFEVPESWEWCRLGEIITLLSGQDLTPDRYFDTQKGIPYITGASHFENGNILISRWTETPTSISKKGDLLITCKGTVGTMAYNTYGEMHIARQIMAINTYLVFLPYVKYFLSFIVEKLKEQSHGVIPGISREDILQTPIPLPPLAEQERIVAKVEELLQWVDVLEENETALNAAAETAKKRILDLAISGKLVEQNPADEPASELLKRIRKEKEAMVKAGKLKKKDLDSKPIAAEEIPFEVPESWKWCRLGEIILIRDGERIPLSLEVRSKQNNKVYDYYGATGVVDKVDGYLFDERLLLIGEDGANLLSRTKNNAFFAEGKYWVNNHAHVLDCKEKHILDYIAFFINSSDLEDYITGSAQPKLNQDNLIRIPIPLPPLAEQERIVAKVEELFGILEKLQKF